MYNDDCTTLPFSMVESESLTKRQSHHPRPSEEQTKLEAEGYSKSNLNDDEEDGRKHEQSVLVVRSGVGVGITSFNKESDDDDDDPLNQSSISRTTTHPHHNHPRLCHSYRKHILPAIILIAFLWGIAALIASSMVRKKSVSGGNENDLLLLSMEENYDVIFKDTTENVKAACNPTTTTTNLDNKDDEVGRREECIRLCKDYKCCFPSYGEAGCRGILRDKCEKHEACHLVFFIGAKEEDFGSSGDVTIEGSDNENTTTNKTTTTTITTNSTTEGESKGNLQTETKTKTTTKKKTAAEVNVVCNSNNIRTEFGRKECLGICQGYECCFPPRGESGCRGLLRDKCEEYEACGFVLLDDSNNGVDGGGSGNGTSKNGSTTTITTIHSQMSSDQKKSQQQGIMVEDKIDVVYADGSTIPDPPLNLAEVCLAKSLRCVEICNIARCCNRKKDYGIAGGGGGNGNGDGECGPTMSLADVKKCHSYAPCWEEENILQVEGHSNEEKHMQYDENGDIVKKQDAATATFAAVQVLERSPPPTLSTTTSDDVRNKSGDSNYKKKEEKHETTGAAAVATVSSMNGDMNKKHVGQEFENIHTGSSSIDVPVDDEEEEP